MIRYIYVALLSVALSSFNSHAQTSADKRTATTKIADLLAQLPAHDAKQLQSSMLQISQLGEEGYVQLITGLMEAGKESNAIIEYVGDDVKVVSSERLVDQALALTGTESGAFSLYQKGLILTVTAPVLQVVVDL